MFYKKLKRFDEAERDYNLVLNTREQFLEDHHPEILSIKHNLSELFFAKGDKDKAAEYAKEILEANF
jgi:tetratricopeptide (TPR) repeat protein